MKNPVDVVTGEVLDINPDGTVNIRAYYNDWPTFVKRGYRQCRIQFIDSRKLSDKQRRTCYGLIRQISNYTGMGMDQTKEYMKLKFLAEDLEETADQIFSLSDAPMSLVCAFERFLVRFILDWDIPCSFPLLDFVDDTADYLYACLSSKKCCICGRKADLHHCGHVGMGRDREDIIHEGMEAIPLCREHHEECHNIGQASFNERYHIERGIVLDKQLCKLYGLKTRKEET